MSMLLENKSPDQRYDRNVSSCTCTSVINPSREANDRQRDPRYELAKGIHRLGLENSSTQFHVNMNLGIDWYKRKLQVNL
ncbi:unnamed protein product [Lasius platythorax]|uniref:Uncharacterized protein n=1 Tax=Lasius platythorax TaxID=488582 RepID=A0AAV2NWQ6_9HYME